MNKNLLALYGLKWNPFSQDVPTEALLVTPRVEHFFWRIEHSHVRDGGFALITGEPGTGKSVAMRLLADRLSRLGEIQVGAMEHPQSNVADFYREMGDLFDVALRPHNRWGGFKALRERWLAHIESTLARPVLLIDEGQEMSAVVLSELRLLASTRFDSRTILSVVLAGDSRLTDKLRCAELVPLGSRIRVRLVMEPATHDELRQGLEHLLAAAGAPRLMTDELKHTLCEHAMGNFRVLTGMADELLAAAAKQEKNRLDEQLFLEVFQPPRGQPAPPPVRRGKRRSQ